MEQTIISQYFTKYTTGDLPGSPEVFLSGLITLLDEMPLGLQGHIRSLIRDELQHYNLPLRWVDYVIAKIRWAQDSRSIDAVMAGNSAS